MKSIGILAVAALLATPALADDVCQLPRCLDVVVPVPAGLVVPDSTVRVLLPTDYDGHRRYPVLYLLHGHGDDRTLPPVERLMLTTADAVEIDGWQAPTITVLNPVEPPVKPLATSLG